MCSRFRDRMRPRAALVVALLALAACDREERRFREVPPAGSPTDVVRLSDRYGREGTSAP